MNSVIKIETATYGVIISRHFTPEAAKIACEKKCAVLVRRNRNVIAHLVYTTAVVDGRKGERVRYS